MFNYVLVCVCCWGMTMVHYGWDMVLSEGHHPPAWIEVLARGLLYSSGFFNMLVFGLSDPHLRRSLKVIFVEMGCANMCCILSHVDPSVRIHSTEKVVMFDEATLIEAANSPKSSKNVYIHARLSKF